MCVYIYYTYASNCIIFKIMQEPGQVYYGIPMRKNSSDFKSAKYGFIGCSLIFLFKASIFKGDLWGFH